MKSVEIYHVEHSIGSGNTDDAVAFEDSNCLNDATAVFATNEFLNGGDTWERRLAFGIAVDQKCHIYRRAQLGECCEISALHVFVINEEPTRLILFAKLGPIYLVMQFIEIGLLLTVIEILSCF